MKNWVRDFDFIYLTKIFIINFIEWTEKCVPIFLDMCRREKERKDKPCSLI